MAPQPRIKMFWDLESCPPPTSYPGSAWDLFKAIRLFAHRYGIITSIKAYWDGVDSSNSGESTDPLRAAMPSMGVGLVDCSLVKEYSKDALSRTLAVDLLISAIDDPNNVDSPGNGVVIIISGDKSILHPVTLMMLRGYTIYLVIPDELNGVERSRASKVFNWHADVLSLNSDPSLEPTSISSRESSILESQESKGPGRSPQTARARVGLRKFSSTSHTSATGKTSDMASSYPTSPRRDPGDVNPWSPQTQPASIPASYPNPLNPFLPSTTPAMTPRTISRPIPVGSPAFRARSALDFNRTTTHSFNPVRGESTEDIRGQMMDQLSLPPTQEESSKETIDDWAAKSNWNNKGGWEMDGASWLPKPERPESRAFHLDPKVDTFRSKGPIPKASQVKRPIPGHETGPDPAAVDSSVFIPLLQNLQRARTEGKTEVLRSVIGAVFAKDKSIYEAAGVDTFNGYITLAAKKGLVNLGGIGGKAWIALK
ncbi:hypothetical protein Agabi119p4_3567 [Agaricus bisporus var. burnettii]|uniref:NYN domain-containing protein n=1 Tax=Agaricus bisporus var. burnettii TaxID=192524 RepID=A0A8H7F563_AGABI|nr:hypothetical protein Agabi119p4_3567 [Agaricus bisporus var. burnettii]